MLNRNTLALATLLLASFNLYAQDGSTHPLFEDDWIFRIGGQQSDADAKAGLANPNIGEIPVIDLNAVDADTTVTSFFGNVVWQGPERWSLGFKYFQAEVTSERVSDEDFTFGDITIPADTGFTADFTTDFYILNGYWDFYQSSNRAAGIGLGLYGMQLDLTLAAQVGGESSAQVESADALAPLPVISAYYMHAFNEHLAMTLEGGWLGADIGDYDGDIVAASISLDYWFNDNWGLGLGYNYVDLDLTVDEDIFDQYYKVKYDSFYFYATFGF